MGAQPICSDVAEAHRPEVEPCTPYRVDGHLARGVAPVLVPTGNLESPPTQDALERVDSWARILH